MSPLRAALAAVTLTMTLPAAAQAATWSVDNTTDTPVGQACAGTTGCSLREAITSANAASGADTIEVAAGTYTLSHGELEADDDVTIVGDGASTTDIDADHASRALYANAAVTLQDLTIRNGQAGNSPGNTSAFGGAILGGGALVLDGVTLADNAAMGSDNSYGGAIYTTSSLLVQDSLITSNRATSNGSAGGALYVDNSDGYLHVVDSILVDNFSAATTEGNTGGGAIYASTADLQISGSQLSHNQALTSTSSASGGAILTGFGVTALITDSVLGSNSAQGGNGAGGAVFLGGPAAFTIRASTFVGNEAVGSGPSELGQGGGIASSPYSGGTLHIENSTLTGNLATGYNTSGAMGGGLYAGLPATIEASTITGNEARILGGGSGTGAGGGVAATDFSAAVPVTVYGSIISGNTQQVGGDCAYGTLQSTGGNVLYVDTGAPDCARTHSGDPDVDTDTPGVAALGDNGGPTPTRPLLPTSPALDLYDSGCPATDQRGVSRPQGPACDAGAVEMRPATFHASPMSLDFGSALIGTTTPAQVTTLTNMGDFTGTPAPTLEGTDPITFTADGCADPVAPRATCDVSVTYTPDAEGAQSAELAVDGTALVALSGVGAVEPPPPSAALSSCTDLAASTAFQTATSVSLSCSPTVWNWEVVGAPAHGTLGPIDAAGTLAYTPAPGFSGIDTFQYRANGPGGSSNLATVTVTVGAGPASSSEASTAAAQCPTRSVTIRVNPSGVRLVRAQVTVDGVAAQVERSGQRWTASFELHGTPGQQVTVQITGRRSNGRLLKRTRTLTVC